MIVMLILETKVRLDNFFYYDRNAYIRNQSKAGQFFLL